MPSDGRATVARPRGCEGALARFPLPWPEFISPDPGTAQAVLCGPGIPKSQVGKAGRGTEVCTQMSKIPTRLVLWGGGVWGSRGEEGGRRQEAISPTATHA